MNDPERFVVGGARLELWTSFLTIDAADARFRDLRAEVPWRELVSQRMGTMPRLGAWYADNGAAYEYSGVTMLADASVPPSVVEARRLVQEALGVVFPYVLVTLYRDGRDSVGWHSDDESLFGGDPIVASLSLGATRRFELKTKPDGRGDDLDLVLPPGSLVVMWPPAQQRLLHRVPKELDRPTAERINLTFRAPS